MTDTALTADQILAALAKIVEEITEIPAAEITMDKHFVDDLDVDSLSVVEILAKAEEEFGIDIKDEDLAEVSTVGDVVTQIQKIWA